MNTDAENGLTRSTYDAVGNLTTVVDPNQHATIYRYDVLNRLEQATEGNIVTSFTYDNVGNQITQEDGNGLTEFTYDKLDRLTDINYQGGAHLHYVYDPTGNIKSFEYDDARLNDPQFSKYNFAYDMADRLVEEVFFLGETEIARKVFSYDRVGNRVTMDIFGVGLAKAYSLDYTRDGLNRLKSVVDPDGTVTNYSYDANSNLETIVYPNNTTTEHVFDNFNRITSIKYRRKNKALEAITYTYDQIANRMTKSMFSGTESYGYDDVYRLVSANYPDGRNVIYEYDPTGNRILLEESFDLSGRGQPSPGLITVISQYNLNNQLIKERREDNTGVKTMEHNYDLVGNETLREGFGVSTRAYVYDKANRLIEVDKDGSGSSPELKYWYDGEGRRIRRENTVTGEVTIFVYDGLDSILELKDDSGTFLETKRFVAGIYMEDVEIPGRSYYHKDALGTIVLITDHEGEILKKYQYDAFGGVENVKGEDKNPKGFIGLDREQDLDLVYMNARWYDPGLGRFLSRDPVAGDRLHPQSLNRYVYVVNNPTAATDRFGTIAPLVVAVGLAVISGYGVYEWYFGSNDEVSDPPPVEKEPEAVAPRAPAPTEHDPSESDADMIRDVAEGGASQVASVGSSETVRSSAKKVGHLGKALTRIPKKPVAGVGVILAVIPSYRVVKRIHESERFSPIEKLEKYGQALYAGATGIGLSLVGGRLASQGYQTAYKFYARGLGKYLMKIPPQAVLISEVSGTGVSSLLSSPIVDAWVERVIFENR